MSLGSQFQLLPCIMAIFAALGLLVCPSFSQFDPQVFQQKMKSAFGTDGLPFMRMSPQERERLSKVPISLEEEKEFGERVLQQYTEGLERSGQVPQGIRFAGTEVDYLAKLVQSLRPSMRHQDRYSEFRIGLIQSDQIDAFSIPGGILLFSKGLVEEVGNEAALVGVVAHELVHLDRQHQLIGLRKQKLLKTQPNAESFMQALSDRVKPMHPELEEEADRIAVEWMVAAGYDPRELGKVLLNWDRRQNTERPWVDFMPTFLLSHPDSGDRAQKIFQQSRKASRQKLYVGQKNLELRIPKSEQVFE